MKKNLYVPNNFTIHWNVIVNQIRDQETIIKVPVYFDLEGESQIFSRLPSDLNESELAKAQCSPRKNQNACIH